MPQAVIEIRDEVNIRFRGLPKHLLKQAVDALSWYVDGYKFMPAYVAGRWNGKISLFTETGHTYFNLIEEVLPIFEAAGYTFDVEDRRLDYSHITDQITLPTADMFSDYCWKNGEPVILRDYQVAAVHAAIQSGAGMLEMATGAGKAQPLHSVVYTPTGPVCMGDIQTGDTVCTIDGKHTKVIGVYPQGVKNRYEITFQDGRTVECCDEHLWWVYDKRIKRHGPNRRGVGTLGRFDVMPAKTIKKILDDNNTTSLQVPLAPVEYPVKSFMIKPYTMGVILGDGSTRNGSTRNGTVTITTMDSDIIERVREETHFMCDWTVRASVGNGLATTYGIKRWPGSDQKHVIRSEIMKYGLDNTLSHEKFIPVDYLEGSIEQRMDLLRGLMDSDGYISKTGTTSYTSTSKQLADDVVELIRSLGGIANLTVRKQPFYRDSEGNKVMGRPAYNVFFQLPNPEEVVYCTRKKVMARKTQYSDGLSLRITGIRELEPVEMQCISVEDESRVYITDGYTVTHNTIVCAAVAATYCPHGKVIVIVPNIDLAIQTQATFKRVGIDCGIWYGEMKDARQVTISTWQSLDNYPELMEGVIAVILDEAHQAKAKTIGDIMSTMACNVPFRFGCTGSIPKEVLARNQVFAVVGEPIFRLKAWELQRKGVLAQSHTYQIVLNDSDNPHYINADPFEDWAQQVDWMFTDRKRMETLAQMIHDTAQLEGNTLVLVQYQRHAEALAEMIPNAVSMDGRVKSKKRQEVYQWFGANEGNVLICTFGIASTGLDIPEIRALYMVEPGKKFEKVIQSIGRVLRKADGKDSAIIADIVGNTDWSLKHAKDRRRMYKNEKYPFSVESLNYVDT